MRREAHPAVLERRVHAADALLQGHHRVLLVLDHLVQLVRSGGEAAAAPGEVKDAQRAAVWGEGSCGRELDISMRFFSASMDRLRDEMS